MGKRETPVQNSIRLAAALHDCALFRINTGRGWTGNNVERLPSGKVLIHDPRPFSTGVPTGYPDLAGWTPVVITPEMVGKKMAVFTAVEVKAGSRKATAKQKAFIDSVIKAGGYAGVANSDEAFYLIIKKDPEGG